MRKGFTLIELIVVIAIIAILAAIVAPNAFRAVEKSKIAKAIADFKGIKSGANALYADTGNWPHGGDSSVQVINSDLMRNVSGWAGWDGPYLSNFLGMHQWRGGYFFTTNAQLGQGANFELSLEFEDWCYPAGPNGGCPIPTASLQNIDETVDDGVLTTGEFRGGSDSYWVLTWDLCPAYACW